MVNTLKDVGQFKLKSLSNIFIVYFLLKFVNLIHEFL